MIGWILLSIMHLVGNIAWLLKDNTPPAWDQAAHIRSVVLVNQWLAAAFASASASQGKSLVELIRSFGGYPPLVYFIGGVWSVISGIGISRITMLGTVFLIAAMVGVYFLALELGGRKRVALMAAVLFSLMNVVFEASRNFLLDLPLLVWVVWGMYFYFGSDNFLKTRETIGFWACLVLASLTKMNGVIYFVPLVLMGIWGGRKEIRMWKNLVVMGIWWSLAVGWWWVVNWRNIYEYLTGLAGQGEPLTDPTNLLSFWTWWHYFKLFFLQQLGPMPTIILLICLAWLPKDRKIRSLGFWLAFNYLVFSIIKNKDFRFTMPLLPVVAIWWAMGLEKINRWWLTAVVVIFLVFNYVNNSYGWPIKKDFTISSQTFLFGWVDWINITDYPVREAKWGSWPQWEIVNSVEGKRLLVLINREEINDNNILLQQEMIRPRSFEVVSVGARKRFESEEELEGFINNFDWIVVANNDFEIAPFYGINLEAYKEARDYVLRNRQNYRLVKSFTVYGDKKLFLYSRK